MANPWTYYRRLIMAQGRRSLANSLVMSDPSGGGLVAGSSRVDTPLSRDTYVTCQQGEEGDDEGPATGNGDQTEAEVSATVKDAREMARRRRKHRVNSGVFAPQRYFDNLPPAKVRVEFFTNEKSLKDRLQLYFIKNQRSSLRIRLFNLFLKLLSCVLYIVRTSTDVPTTAQAEYNSTDIISKEVNWTHIIWVERGYMFSLYITQVSIAVISLSETLLLMYLGYKGNIIRQLTSLSFILEIMNTVPLIITACHGSLHNLFVPVFLNIWQAKTALESMLNDLHRAMQRSQSALGQYLLVLTATILCLLFTSVCGIQHLQRGGHKYFDLFDSLWYVIVTFSTVGYGDFYPDIWPSKLFMMLSIVSAFILLPTQFEQLAYTWMERQKQGGTYSSHRAQNEKHVVVVTTTLNTDIILDFLNEFYSHSKLQDFYVVLLSPSELSASVKLLLQVPLWASRVIYIQGSALKDADMSRCRMQDAEACFLVASRNYKDKSAADQHTIMRSWAVKDFAPLCPQYIQLFKPENKFHVKFAEHIVCEDEFKYALLANNTQCPAASTLITLLLHTSRGAEGQSSQEDWIRLYGRCSGNEIYHIKLCNSHFFKDFEDQSFTYASFHSHRKYGVSLVAVGEDENTDSIRLNPGPGHTMKSTDICYYLNITKEENSIVFPHPSPLASNSSSIPRRSNSIKHNLPNNSPTSKGNGIDGLEHLVVKAGNIAMGLQDTSLQSQSGKDKRPDNVDGSSSPLGRQNSHSLTASTRGRQNKRPSIAPVPSQMDQIRLAAKSFQNNVSEECIDDIEDDIFYKSDEFMIDYPPVTPYVGSSPISCYLVKEKKKKCCLILNEKCEHCSFSRACEYEWEKKSIIVISDSASSGLYNFVVMLRSQSRPRKDMSPIVLLMSQRPDDNFTDALSYFPYVYWMWGSITKLDDLLISGITTASSVVIINKEPSNRVEEDTLSDCSTIVEVQSMVRLFPNCNILTELSQSSNLRFMRFRARDSYAMELSKLEKKEKERGSHLYYMFRLPFAAGNVFSSSMLDTLLYQAFVKDYLITIVRLLLGMDQAPGSGHLACMTITKEDLWIRTYGRLNQKLCSTSCEIPIGIYRTQRLKRTYSMATIEGFPGCHQKRNSSSSAANDHTGGHTASTGRTTVELQDIRRTVRSHMSSLKLDRESYTQTKDTCNTLSYVIINPSYEVILEPGDIIYIIRPSSTTVPTATSNEKIKSEIQVEINSPVDDGRPGVSSIATNV